VKGGRASDRANRCHTSADAEAKRTRLLFAATPDLYGEDGVASIPGAPPRLDREIVGCPFRERCDRAFERCRDERPVLLSLGDGRMAACHLNDDPVGAGSARR